MKLTFKVLSVLVLGLLVAGSNGNGEMEAALAIEKNFPGQIPLSKSERTANRTGSLFYWYFPARMNPIKAPLIIWLQGGPGCSSEIAVFKEHGPYKLDPLSQGMPIRNQWSWNTIANMVYVDQPVGTGYSTVPKSKKGKRPRYNKTQEEIAKNFYTFLKGFLEKYPDLQGRELYLTGESYAGHYLPNLAAYINIQRNKDINLKGLIIGNGMLDPFLQYFSVLNFSKHHNLLKGWSTEKLYGIEICFKVCRASVSQARRKSIEWCHKCIDQIQNQPN